MILKPHLPPGTEIDYFNVKALESIVGILFNDIKVREIRWPWKSAERQDYLQRQKKQLFSAN